MKKHDKVYDLCRSGDALRFFESLGVCRGEEVIIAVERLEKHYADLFYDGNERNARASLLLKRSAGPRAWRGFGLGCRFGMAVMLALWLAWDVGIDLLLLDDTGPRSHSTASLNCSAVDTRRRVAVWFDHVFPVYRGAFLVLSLIWVWGVVMWSWDQVRINWLYMLDFRSSDVANPSRVFDMATNLTIGMSLNLLINFKAVRCAFPSPRWLPLGVYPLVLYASTILYLIFPWRRQRILWKIIASLMVSPFYEVTMLMNYAGDVLTSMVKPLEDILRAGCYFGTGEFLSSLEVVGSELGSTCLENVTLNTYVMPCVICFPYFMRFLQCMRRFRDSHHRKHFGTHAIQQLMNAWKYALAMFVTLWGTVNPGLKKLGTSAFTIVWTLAFASSTSYTFWWDVRMDWGLGQRAYGFLRERRMLNSVYFYYGAIVADLFLRFLWTITLLPDRHRPGLPGWTDYFYPVAGVAEICRRGMWSIYRLENEHLHNTAGYRRVQHIPLHFATKEATPDKSKTSLLRTVLEVLAAAILITVLLVVAIFAKPGS